MNDSLDALLDNPAIWRAGEPARHDNAARIASEYPPLDDVLPGGGWPRGALTEVLYEHAGIGELRGRDTRSRKGTTRTGRRSFPIRRTPIRSRTMTAPATPCI